MRNIKRTLAVAATAIGICSGSAMADVELVHDKGFWSEFLQDLGDKSEELTGNRIVEVAYANPEQYKAFIQTSAASGDLPDMFSWWTGGVFEDIVKTEQIAPLDDIWDGMIASGAFNESLRDFYSVDGKAYGVPLHLSRWVALYNTEQFKEAGVEEPETWEEFLAVAETLKEAGFTPFHATVQDGWRGFVWFQEIMIRTDPEAYMGLHDGSVAYDSEPVRNAFKIWSDWYQKGYFTDPRSNDEAADFARGEGAIYLFGDWATGLVEAAGMTPGEDFSAFIIPNKDPSLPSAAILEGSPIVMSLEGRKNPDAVKGLEFFVSVEGANAWAEASGNANGNQLADAPNPIVAKINDYVQENDTIAIGRWWEAVPAELQGELVAELNRFMLDPTMETAEEVMANMQALNGEYWAYQ